MYHARADIGAPEIERLAGAFGTNVILSGEGDAGSLRAVATRNGIPTITVEMGKAHRFQSGLIEKALAGVESVLAEYGVYPDGTVTEPAWRSTSDSRTAVEPRSLRSPIQITVVLTLPGQKSQGPDLNRRWAALQAAALGRTLPPWRTK